MSDALSLAPQRKGRSLRMLLSRMRTRIREQAPSAFDVGLAVLSAILLVLSFPNFNLWPVAWFGLAPLLIALHRAPHLGLRAFILGWITGTLFFYGSCYWLTYAAIRYGHIPTPLSYLFLIPAAAIGGLFPAFFTLILARGLKRFGAGAVLAAPFVWVAMEWARLGVTGQLWNAIGYSQSFVPSLIQSARWGGVFAVGFLIVTTNAAVAFLIIRKTLKTVGITIGLVLGVALVCILSTFLYGEKFTNLENHIYTVVVAVQPNVPMDPVESVEETDALVARHITMSKSALDAVEDPYPTRVVIWPESPMNFMYARDTQFRELLATFTKANRTSVIFNALEPAPQNGAFNSAVMVNEEGRLVAQYDKIRLMPFGEYVPVPRWLPGGHLIPVIVGDFTPGQTFPLLPLGDVRAGIFICYESAFPYIARRFTNDGADVLINISNDGYLGPTPVMKQHLANAVFRAVENNRPLLRVTNTGITAYISPRGRVEDATGGFTTAVRTWKVSRTENDTTFYTRHGDIFVAFCASICLLLTIVSSPRVGRWLRF